MRFSKNEPVVCAIDNIFMVAFSNLAYEREATAFYPVANVYAPYYRQADAAILTSMTQPEQDALEAGAPTVDAMAAFDYFIKHYNNGRPFILASHSQGSYIMRNILSQYMKQHPDVYKRMIAAYVIGYSITPEYLAENPHLKFAEGATDTGVIVSWNTQAPVVKGADPVVLPGALAINPISWTRTEKPAPASQNLGSLIIGSAGQVNRWDVKNFADARVDIARGVVICSTVDVEKYAPGGGLFGKGVFHSWDIPFYYYNLRQNAIDRVNSYFGTH